MYLTKLNNSCEFWQTTKTEFPYETTTRNNKFECMTEMSEVAPQEFFALEDSLAGHEALPTLFDSAIADEPKTIQADAPEPEPAARIDDGLSDDEDEPRLLTRAQKKSGKARIARADSRADENYSPRGPSSKGGKKKSFGKKGSKNLPKVI